MFNKLKLGTKTIAAIVAIVVFCLAIMSWVIITITSNIQGEEAKKLLINASARDANLADSFLSQIYVALESSAISLEQLIQDRRDEKDLEYALKGILDSAGDAVYAYIYILDPYYIQNSSNPNFKLKNSNLLILQTDDDMSGGAFKLFGEYNSNKYFALGGELNYLDQGKVKESISYGPYYRATYDYKFYTVVYGIYAKGSLPVTDNFDVFVKAGPTWNYTSSDTLSDGTKDENCFGWNAGAGVEYRFDNGWGIRAGYDYYHKTIKSLGNRLTGVFDSANSNLIYGGVSYSF